MILCFVCVSWIEYLAKKVNEEEYNPQPLSLGARHWTQYLYWNIVQPCALKNLNYLHYKNSVKSSVSVPQLGVRGPIWMSIFEFII